MSWQVPRMWEDEDVWIIGGGSSIIKQFDIPDKVFQSVWKKTSPPSAYSPYMKFLHDKHVIGTNCAFMIGDWIDISLYGDENFFKRYYKELAEFQGLKITIYPHKVQQDWLKYIPMDKDHPRGISRDPSKISWNKNIGSSAINLAYHTGASRVFLLGFDMNLGDGSRQHWHNVYNRGPIVEPARIKKLAFNSHLRYFPNIAADAKQLGLTIINVNPDSAITQFPKCSLNQLL